MFSGISNLLSGLPRHLRCRRPQGWRCATVWITLFSFVVGNLGFSVPLPASGSSAAATGSCCCGTTTVKPSCCCRPAPKPQATPRSCCSSKKKSAEKTAEPTAGAPRIGCSCHVVPVVEVAISAQPKILPARAELLPDDHWELSVLPADLDAPRSAEQPDTPPPRVLLG